MAQALRQLNHGSSKLPRLIAWFGVGFILLPLLPGLAVLLLPALSVDAWQNLLAEPQVPKALAVTLFSAFASALIALILALGVMLRAYPSSHWQKLQKQTPLFLALPHAAFAIGLAFLFAPSGWFARLIALAFGWDAPPQWITIQDPYGISLTLALAFKECWFLLWVLFALPGQESLSRQILHAQTMAYSRWQIGWQIIFPQILPKMAWALLAVFAYSLSVVDMAIILGPSTPPSLAVLGWQWFSDPSAIQQAMASAVAVMLFGLLLAGALLGWLLHKAYRQLLKAPNGFRKPYSPSKHGIAISFRLIQLVTLLALGLLLLWSVAGSWFFPDLFPKSLSLKSWNNSSLKPLGTTLWLALFSVIIALPIVLTWLEWGPKQQSWLYLPLILPALTLAAAQYEVLLRTGLDHTTFGVIWSHLAWVLPYMVLVLAGSYRHFDNRFVLRGQTLGYSHFQSCLRIKWPMLIRPILAACAVGFAVSVAQYLPTLFAGGGRFETVTTEAVALSAGGNRRTLAIQAVLQASLPLLAFVLASFLGLYAVRNKRGMQ